MHGWTWPGWMEAAGAGGMGKVSRVIIIYEKWLVRVVRLVSSLKNGGNQPFLANHPQRYRVVS
jgi:hypothetical protein